MKKRLPIIILIIWFIWSAVSDLNNLVGTSSTDYYVFSSNNLTPLFFLFGVVIFLLDALTVFYLLRPRPPGFYIAFSALALSIIQSVLSVSLAVSDLPGVRDAYAAGREARGLSVRQEALDMMFTPAAMYAVLALIVLLTAVIAFLLIRNRAYFYRNQPDAEA